MTALSTGCACGSSARREFPACGTILPPPLFTCRSSARTVPAAAKLSGREAKSAAAHSAEHITAPHRRLRHPLYRGDRMNSKLPGGQTGNHRPGGRMNCRCRYWSDCGVNGGGCCSRNLYGGRPSLGVCRLCPQYQGPWRGLGDGIHWIAEPLAKLLPGFAARKHNAPKLSNCGCEKRRREWNRWSLRN